MDRDETWHAGRPRPWPHCVRWGPSSLLAKGGGAPNFRPIPVVAQWLHGSRCHLVWRKDSAQATLCYMGTQLPSSKRGRSPYPIFGLCPLWPNGWMDQDDTWYRGKPRHRQRCVRWGRSSPLKGTQPHQFSVHAYCGQTAGWMKTPLGTEVDLGPGHTV